MKKIAITISFLLISVIAFAQPDSGNVGWLTQKQIKKICRILSGDTSDLSHRFFNQPQEWETVPGYKAKKTRDILAQMAKERDWEFVYLPKSKDKGYVPRYALRNKRKALLYLVGPNLYWDYPVFTIDDGSQWNDYPSLKLRPIYPAAKAGSFLEVRSVADHSIGSSQPTISVQAINCQFFIIHTRHFHSYPSR